MFLSAWRQYPSLEDAIGSFESGVTDCCELHGVPVPILDLFLKAASGRCLICIYFTHQPKP